MKTILIGCTIFLLALITVADCQAAVYSISNNSAATPSPWLRLKMVKDTQNTDEIIIRCVANANPAYVVGVDAPDIGGIDPEVSLSSFSSDDRPMAINVMPFPGLQQEEIPLLTNAIASGIYKLVSSQVEYWPSQYEVWLKDGFTGDSLRMTTNASYSFNIDKNNPARCV